MRVAVVQRPPVLLDRERALAEAIAAIGEVAANGARLVVFPEAHIPGYPAWIWRLRPGKDAPLAERIHRQLLANAVEVEGDHLMPLREAAREHGVLIVCGIQERDAEFSRSTLYNTVVMIGPNGALLNRHRKVMPTSAERMVWGFGDASGLKAVDTTCGRLGALICWENYMPLARYALYAQNLEILIAPTWDCGEEWIASMRHIAREGGCWVIATGTAIQAGDVPKTFPGRDRLFPDDDEWLCDGGALIVRPFGKVEAGPLNREKTVLYCDIDLSAAPRSRRSLDVTGHYARPDIFQLQVNRMPLPPVEFRDT
jgi:nitrilase